MVVDRIPLELWKCEGQALHGKLNEFLVCCWVQEKLSSDLSDEVIVTLYKNKGEKSNYSKNRGITLLFIAGKILAREIQNRLIPTISIDHLSETQCRFRANGGTTDMVFVIRQFQEKYWEQNKGLYVAFVDLTKAFNTVCRKGLCMILEFLGCPQISSAWLSNCTKTSTAKLGLIATSPNPSPSSTGCVQAPILFSVFFSMMLKQNIEDIKDYGAVYIYYRLDSSVFKLGRLFNLRRLYANKKYLRSCSVASSSLITLPSSPTPKEPCSVYLPAFQKQSSSSDSRPACRRPKSSTSQHP